MAITVGQLAELVQGRLVGDGAALVHAARPLKEAGPGDVTFLEDPKYARQLSASHATAVFAKTHPEPNGMAVIEVDDPLTAFLTVYKHLHVPVATAVHGMDARASIHPTAKLGMDASVQAFVSIGENSVVGDRCRLYPGVIIGNNCRLGDDVILYPNVVVYDGCSLGDRVIVHANAVIGADGFGYRFHEGRHVKVPQLAGVEIGDDVEIGAASCIDRGTFQPTRIGQGTKLDNLVQIAHNVTVGKHNLFAAQTAIAGSSTTGDYVVLGGQAGISDHVNVGSGTMVGAKAGVISDTEPGARLHGIPARNSRDARMQVLCIERLPEMRKDLEKVKKQLGIE